MVVMEGWGRRTPCPDCWNSQGWALLSALPSVRGAGAPSREGNIPCWPSWDFPWSSSCSCTQFPIYEPLVPAPLQILAKLLQRNILKTPAEPFLGSVGGEEHEISQIKSAKCWVAALVPLASLKTPALFGSAGKFLCCSLKSGPVLCFMQEFGYRKSRFFHVFCIKIPL